MNNLIEGAVLCTLDGTKVSNAIVAKVIDDLYYVITDYGNMLRFTEQEIFELYIISPDWIEHKHFGYPFSPIPERIQEQILKLQEVLEVYKKL